MFFNFCRPKFLNCWIFTKLVKRIVIVISSDLPCRAGQSSVNGMEVFKNLPKSPLMIGKNQWIKPLTKWNSRFWKKTLTFEHKNGTDFFKRKFYFCFKWQWAWKKCVLIFLDVVFCVTTVPSNFDLTNFSVRAEKDKRSFLLVTLTIWQTLNAVNTTVNH